MAGDASVDKPTLYYLSLLHAWLLKETRLSTQASARNDAR